MKTIKTLFTLALLLTTLVVQGQDRYLTRTGHIKFFSHAPLEDIEAHNNKVLSIVDLAKGQVAVDMLIKAFEFEKKLMQEHFNENYMESDKHPKSTFKGTFEVPQELKAMIDGTYVVDVKGDLSVHGVTKPLNTKATLKVSGGKLSGDLVFKVKVKDHEIKIPKVVVRNIADEVEVTATFEFEPYK
ncbi:YceI family protein [Roseivirga sp. E12]|uniref:YceI family protein n=1 Tax=Roseivirga sp. E12 TaxID=2819237 RepID=UPI001ABD368E|nr:YceI family protein [Roseivirga sp. E12]MBO3697132.1 YceI family protein [Roseivirga sp. E12]